LKTFEGPVWIALGVGACLYAYAMGLGTFREPGVGFVAFATGLFLAAVGVLLRLGPSEAAQGARQPGDRQHRAVGPVLQTKTFKLFYTLAILVVYAILLNPLGYILTTFLVMFGLFFDPGRRRFKAPMGAALLSAATTYVVFEMWLRSQLPRGIFPWW